MQEINSGRAIVLFLVIITLMIVREGYLFERESLHFDESLSLSISSYSNDGFRTQIKEGEYTGNDIRRIMWENKFTPLETTINLWQDNRDPPHSNVFYTLLQLWNRVPNNSIYSAIPLWSAQLNILLYALSALSLYIFSLLLFRKTFLSIAIVVISGMASQSISNTIFIRPYQLQDLMFVIYTTLLFISSAKKSNNNSFIFLFTLTTAITALTGYFAIIYIALTFPVFVYYKIINHGYRSGLIKSSLVVASSIATAFVIYPRYFFLNNYRSQEAIGKIGSFSENLSASLSSMKIFGDNFYLFFAIFSISILALFFDALRNKKNEAIFLLYISIAASLWCFVVMFFAPYKTPRYIYPALPIIALVYSYVFHIINGKSSFIIVIIACVMATYNLYNNGRVEFLFKDKPVYCTAIHNNNAVIHMDKYYMMGAIASCFNESKTYLIYNDNLPKDKLKNYNLMISDEKLTVPDFSLSKNQEQNGKYFSIYQRVN